MHAVPQRNDGHPRRNRRYRPHHRRAGPGPEILRRSIAALGRSGMRLLTVTTVATTAVSLAPSAAADPATTLRTAVTQLRGGTSCRPLRPDASAEEASAIVIRSTDKYLDHTARAVPVSDPLPILKDLGSGANKAKLLQGAGRTEADAIEFVLISGYAAIPDCSFTDYGVSALQNTLSGYFLTSMVLAGS